MVMRLIKRWAPSFVLDAGRDARRVLRRIRWQTSVRKGTVHRYSEARLLDDLQSIGVSEGHDLFVHCSLSSIGLVEGGPRTFIGALIKAIGPSGTLLMPAFSLNSTMLQVMADSQPFIVNESESTMGAVTKVFRLMPGIFRSAHPTHSVCALGPRGEFYTSQHHISRSPCGPGSPFRLLSDTGGKILCVGSGIGKVTSHHTIEDLVDRFPVSVYLPREYSKLVVFPDGTQARVPVLVHDPELSSLRVDNCKPKEQEVHLEMRAAGLLSEGRIGDAVSQFFGAAELNNFHSNRLKRGLTIYDLSGATAV